MGERGVRNAEVEGSNPLPSTTSLLNHLCLLPFALWRPVAELDTEVTIQARRR